MYQPVRLQSGDLVRIPDTHHPNTTIYGILFYLNESSFLLMPNGVIEKVVSIESLEWVCHTALVHGSYFHSLEQVRQNFIIGIFDHVIASIPIVSTKH